jgi:protein ImuA
MSPGGSSERISFLRAAIARLETGQALGPAAAGGEVSEVVPASAGDRAAACGFALTLAARAAGTHGTILWVVEDFVLAEAGLPYGPGLAEHGIDPGRLVLVRAATARQALWALEEALRSPACAVAVGEVVDAARHCDLAQTRRLVVAARASGAQGILLHGGPTGDLSTAAQTRFEVRSRPGPLLASAGERRPIPDCSAWGVRVLKARATQGRGRLPDPERLEPYVGGAPAPALPPALPLPRRSIR